MDDSQTLDDLAALFLGSTGGSGAPAGLVGPPPVRLRPKPAADPVPPAPAGPAAPTRLRLADDPDGEDRARTGGPADPPAVPALEAVVLGNLPGLADAWLPQYAQLIAHRDGPVLLLHPVGEDDADDPLRGGDGGGGGGGGRRGAGFDLEWIGPGGAEASALLDGLDDASGLVERVGLLLHRAAQPPAALLVHAGSDGPEAASRYAAASDWSVLSGADPVAIQAAASALRRIVAAAPELASASVGLMVMGSGDEAGGPAVAALDAALPGVLDQPAELLGTLPRMNPVTRTRLGFAPDAAAGNGETGGWPRLCAWLDRLPGRRDAAPEADEADDPDDPGLEDLDDDGPGSAGTGLRLHGGAGVVVHAGAGASGGPSGGPPVAGAGAALVGCLARAIPAGPRLDPVAPGCPGQPGVQLALDEHGRLHLLARHTHSESHPHPREAMLALRDAADWAREHQAWLSAAHPHRRVDASEPVPHLLTDRPDLGLSLAKKLGPALRLYLLHGDICWSLTES